MAPRRTSRPLGTPANSTAATTANSAPARTAAAETAAASRTYESSPVPHQVTFPARRKVVRTYGRRSLPAGWDGGEAGAGMRTRRSLRQQTLTQIVDFDVAASSMSGAGGLADDLVEEGNEAGDDHDGDGEEQEDVMDMPEETSLGKGRSRRKKESASEMRDTRTERRSKRRKTADGAPTPTPGLSRKGSSFHTQTLTQFLGNSAEGLDNGERTNVGLRVDDSEEDNDDESREPAPGREENGNLPAIADPRTPSHKRIQVDLDEVPSSQPTPFTPMLERYSPLSASNRSPLTQKSRNINAPPPTAETVSKTPRNLVIQDSYSIGSSEGLSSSSAAEQTPGKDEKRSQEPERAPLAEIPVASLDLGGTPPNGETPNTRRKRLFFEIPDSDDELESVGSTPFKTRSTQQTPLRTVTSATDDAEIAANPSFTLRHPSNQGSATPLGASDKENSSPAIRVWDDDESTASEGDEPGTPTPTQGRTRSQAVHRAGRASQVTPNTASQFWTASSQVVGSTVKSAGISAKAPTQPAAPIDLTVAEEPAPSTPTPAPRPLTSQRRADTEGTQDEDSEEPTASESEQEHMPVSILKKTPAGKALHTGSSSGGERKATPEVATSEDSTGEAQNTPTPAIRRVQIELPPPSTAEEVYKETPRKAHKMSSPIYQRHTQARFQYYSQGLESQRIPLDVIHALGPQTDRSDILIAMSAEHVDGIIQGTRDHEFRNYMFPMQVARCWIFTGQPAGEIKYMATLGPAQRPGHIDSNSGLGNAEFNAGTSGFKFAHKLLQVYQLNNPVPQADMPDNGLGEGPPPKYKYLPPAIVGQLLANLRCALFADEEEDEDEDEAEDEEDSSADVGRGSATISQELEEQLRSDILHTTQMMSSERHCRHKDREGEEEEEDIIPASQSPLKSRSSTSDAPAQRSDDAAFVHRAAAAPAPPRSSQRLQNRHQPASQEIQQRARRQTKTTTISKTSTRSNTIRPSQATTASDISLLPSSSSYTAAAAATAGATTSPSPSPSSLSSSSSVPTSSTIPHPLPRPSLPESGELSLPPLLAAEDSIGMGMGMGSAVGAGMHPSLVGSSSLLLPPDSLVLGEEEGVRMAPPPVEVWDSEEDMEEDEDEEEEMEGGEEGDEEGKDGDGVE